MGSIGEIFVELNLLYKATKLRKTFNKLKEVRKEGYEKKYGKSRGCWDYFMLCLCAPCSIVWSIITCKCCVYVWPIFETPFFQRPLVKSIIGFVVGLVGAWLVFALVFYQFRSPRAISIGTCVILAIFLSLGLALSKYIRLLVMVALPSLCSSTTRAVILTVVLVLVVQGPFLNIAFNASALGEAISCTSDNTKDEVKTTSDRFLFPVTNAFNVIKNATQEFERKMQEKMQHIIDVLENAKDVLEKVKDTAKNLCQTITGFIDTLCGVVFDEQECNLQANVCDFPQQLAKKAKNYINSVIQPRIDELKNEIYFNITTDRQIAYNFTSSKTFREVFKEVKKEVARRFSWFGYIVDFAQLFSFLLPLWSLFRASLYIRSFKSKDHYDNLYVSKPLVVIDAMRFQAGKETVLPLQNEERRRYIDPLTLRYTSSETARFIFGLILLSITAIQAFFYLAIDYALYWLIQLLIELKQIQISTPGPPTYNMTVDGSGALSDMYRDIANGANLEVPEPEPAHRKCDLISIEPDEDNRSLILRLLAFSLLTVFLETYALRTRSRVCSWYFPDRAKIRAAWLYNQIIQRRGSFLRFVQKQVKHRIGYDYVEPVSFLDRLTAIFPCVRIFRKAFCGYNPIFCVHCGRQGDPADKENFMKCEGTDNCTGLYCKNCLKDLDNVCAVCSQPIEITNDSDGSEELDSSDEGSDYYNDDYCNDWTRITHAREFNKMRQIAREFRREGVKPYHSSDEESLSGDETVTEDVYKYLNSELGLTRAKVDAMRNNAKLTLESTHSDPNM